MPSDAMIGWGTLFQTESLNSPNDWTTLAEVSAINPPAPSRDALDLSFGNAPDEWRTSIPGMPSAGEITLEFNFVPSGTAYAALKAEFDDREVRRRRLVFPQGEAMVFDAFITSLSSEVSVGDKLKASAKFQVTGEIDPLTAAGSTGEWIETWSAAVGSVSPSWAGFTTRHVLMSPLFSVSGDAVRLTMKGPAPGVANTDIVSMYIGPQAVSGDVYDFDGTQVQVMVSGSGQFIIPIDATVVSDSIPLSFNKNKNYVIAISYRLAGASNISLATGLSAVNYPYWGSKNATDASTTDATGYTTGGNGRVFVVSRIEAFVPPS